MSQVLEICGSGILSLGENGLWIQGKCGPSLSTHQLCSLRKAVNLLWILATHVKNISLSFLIYSPFQLLLILFLLIPLEIFFFLISTFTIVSN